MFHHNLAAMRKTVKILLVDDDLKNSILLRRFIEAEGYHVDYAPDGGKFCRKRNI